MYITNEKLQKIENEIIKIKVKISTLTTKLRKLECDKTAMKNAEFLAVLNGANISTEELRAFIQSQKEQSGGNTTEPPDRETIKNDKEDTDEQI
jgi:paraquat-inducible protein B